MELSPTKTLSGPTPPVPLWRRFCSSLWRITRVVLLAYIFLVVGTMFFEDSLIYFPSGYPQGDWHPTAFPFEDAWFEAADGTRLHGWYVPKKNARAAVLFCHGNGGNITHRAAMLRMLRDRVGVSVLMFDYRGYGRSEGKPSEEGLYADARAARAWLAAREKIPESDVVLMGESLGGAVAVDLAAQDGARALILESTFSSLPEVGAYHYPILPVRWAMRSQFDSAGKIGDYHGPLLQAHGEDDTIVPLQFGERLFEAANEPKEFIRIPDQGHNALKPARYFDAMSEFVDKLPR